MQERVAGVIKELQPLIQVSIRDRCHVISIVALRGYSGVVERRRCVRSRDICLLDSIVLIEQANRQISWISMFTFYGQSSKMKINETTSVAFLKEQMFVGGASLSQLNCQSNSEHLSQLCFITQSSDRVTKYDCSLLRLPTVSCFWGSYI